MGSSADIDLLSASKFFKDVYGQNSVLSNLLGSSNSKPLTTNEMDDFGTTPSDNWSKDDTLAGALALSASSPQLSAQLMKKMGQGAMTQLSMLLASLQQANFDQLTAGPEEPTENPTLDTAAAIQADKLKPFLKIE